MVAIHSVDEFNFLSSIMPDGRFWLGYFWDATDELTFESSDGTKFNFTKWSADEPNKPRQNQCVALTASVILIFGTTLLLMLSPFILTIFRKMRYEKSSTKKLEKQRLKQRLCVKSQNYNPYHPDS
ncbi:hypothetical protein B4U79_18026 [Dinothrombium tinctorium]|uniref:C-type lectin domain-containing protein n=1 Tax=Dinothrombium tinctorium TaxID=1965070 RepID=A0A443R9V9_9ACAR|nr:hypothetical protein B4U79_18027 [Dinothrombium tinctorium]RWS12056.1 hypothetical protein B4U79_18026 [Dinothrombium tinctorium]